MREHFSPEDLLEKPLERLSVDALMIACNLRGFGFWIETPKQSGRRQQSPLGISVLKSSILLLTP